MNDEVQMIPIERIRILNLRDRDRNTSQVMVESIKIHGLKKPIEVILRGNSQEGGSDYDLVCGQARIEAFTTLGYKKIPAIVVKIEAERGASRTGHSGAHGGPSRTGRSRPTDVEQKYE